LYSSPLRRLSQDHLSSGVLGHLGNIVRPHPFLERESSLGFETMVSFFLTGNQSYNDYLKISASIKEGNQFTPNGNFGENFYFKGKLNAEDAVPQIWGNGYVQEQM
jgi:hypothetical protein